MTGILFFLFCCVFTVHSQKAIINPFKYPVTKNIVCEHGAVVSAHALASQVGVSILQQGGNAVDAAIAVQLALAVVYPAAGNIGGGGFMVARLKNTRSPGVQGKNIAIDYREMAPLAATKNMYLDENGSPQSNLSLNGHLSAGVPGTVAGLFASMKYARLPFKKLIQPAIGLAEKGFAITAAQAQSFNEEKNEFIKLNIARPVFVKEESWKGGDTLIQKDLAKTLIRIRDLGMKDFYEGETAKMIVDEMQNGRSLPLGRRGIITYEDLKNYTAKEREAVIFNYKGYKIITMPLPSSGGILLQQMLKMIEKRNIAAMKFHTPRSVQLMVEAERRAFADRAEFMGDPDFVKVPVKTLVSEQYLASRMQNYEPGKAGNSSNIKAGKINIESEETTHLSVVDNEGNAVSVTTTLNNSYGSKTIVTGAGFLLNDEMDDFSVKPGVPNLYGAIGNEANAIEPGKRMLSSMAPTIVLKNNTPYLVVGTPGGTTIPTSVFQTIVNIIDFKLSTTDAVNKSKFHHQWLPDEVNVEKEFPVELRDELIKMGYKLKERETIGRTEAIKILTESSSTKRKIEAIADKRGDDSAAGY
jgi:gamma-glutamyltranspeptidase/glutathione hydrolase